MHSVDESVRPVVGKRSSDLVPSRYALQVGDIDVLVISDGVLPLPAATLATNALPADLSAWLKEKRLAPDVYTWPLNVVVVRSGSRTILIDAGVGEAFPDFRAGQLAVRRNSRCCSKASTGACRCAHTSRCSLLDCAR